MQNGEKALPSIIMASLDPWICIISHDHWVCTIILQHPYDIHTRAIYQYIPFKCARQNEISRPLVLYYFAQPFGLHYNLYVSLALPLSMRNNLARSFGLHFNHNMSLSVRPSSVSKMLITFEQHGIF